MYYKQEYWHNKKTCLQLYIYKHCCGTTKLGHNPRSRCSGDPQADKPTCSVWRRAKQYPAAGSKQGQLNMKKKFQAIGMLKLSRKHHVGNFIS